MATNNVLYWSGTMPDSDPTVDTQISQTNPSGFTTVLLWSLHVNTANPSKNVALGDLTWNDTLLVSSYTGSPVFDPGKNFTNLATRLATLLKGGTVNNVFFSIGAGGTSDFTTIQQLMQTTAGQATLKNNFACLLQNLSMITGFDFDDEDNFDVNTVAGFTQFLVTNFKTTVTYCPYGDWNMAFWESCLEAVYKNMGSQPVAWYNLQCYSGGDNTNPLTWVSNIKSNQSKNGVANADAFIVPGYAANNTGGDGGSGMLCPSDICQLFTGYKGQVPGGFIWNSQHLFNDPAPCSGSTATIAQYAQAISGGLSGNCP